MVPNIRPLETLHNSLSLNQITDFFDNIIQASIDSFDLTFYTLLQMDGLGNQHNEAVADTLSMASDKDNKLKQQGIEE